MLVKSLVLQERSSPAFVFQKMLWYSISFSLGPKTFSFLKSEPHEICPLFLNSVTHILKIPVQQRYHPQTEQKITQVVFSVRIN